LLHARVYSFSQTPTDYSLQQDDTLVRKTWLAEVAANRKMITTGLPKAYASDYKKIYDDQFEEIEDLVSTRSVTAQAANNYLQSVIRKVTAVNPELAKLKTRIFFTRDWWPNAFSMGEGTIGINAGLMVFLHNEAELVFVICHEFAHYYRDHTQKSIHKYVETINNDAFQAELKRLSKTEFGVNKQLEALSQNFAFNNRRHSRENEAEADRYAFNFMKKTGYDVGAIRSCLELLDKVDDTLFSATLKLDQALNFEQYPFKDKWIRKESAIFSQMNEDDSPLSKKAKDSLKTHPACQQRISFLADSINAHQNSNSFLVDENLFNRLKKDFFREMAEQCYRKNNLSRNLYYSLLLLQDNKEDPMAINSVVRCLNLLYENQKNHKVGLAIDSESKNYPEQYNLLLRMLRRLRLDEIAAINQHFCKKYAGLMKDNPDFTKESAKAFQLNKS
jgi:Zn-dependent protease with chaperone function